MPNKLKTYHFHDTAVLSPAYGRYFITREQAVENFKRGLDWKDCHTNLYVSIRDCAPGCIVELRYGKRLQKSTTYTIPTSNCNLANE